MTWAASGLGVLAAALATSSANAGETTTFTYDALGRVVTSKYERTGTTTAITNSLEYDAAGNRKQYTVTGVPAATPAGGPNLVVVGGQGGRGAKVEGELLPAEDYDPRDVEFMRPVEEAGQ